MAMQPLVGTRGRRVPDSLIARAATVATPRVSDNMNRLVAAGSGIRPLHSDHPMAGRALTIQTGPGDDLSAHEAIDIAESSDVVHPSELVRRDAVELPTLRADEAGDAIGKAEAQLATEKSVMQSIEDGCIDHSWVDELLRVKGST